MITRGLWAVVGAAFMAAFLFAVYWSGNGEIIYTSLGALGVKLIFGLVVVRVVLKNYDLVLDFDFKNWLQTAHPMPKAFYLGCRVLAVFIFAGMVLS